MIRTHRYLFLALALAAALSLGVAGCRDRDVSDVTDLESVEVREYEGADLSSISEFRENSIKGPQEVDRSSYRLKITGMVDTPLSLTYQDVIEKEQAYRKVVRLSCVEGWSVDILWQGVRLTDLLDKAGADPDASVIIFTSADGYSTSLPAEYIRDNDILLAYRMNDVELPADRGFPFQLVAQEKWGYKWAKWITGIEVSDDTSFKGYWESRGYDNDADR